MNLYPFFYCLIDKENDPKMQSLYENYAVMFLYSTKREFSFKFSPFILPLFKRAFYVPNESFPSIVVLMSRFVLFLIGEREVQLFLNVRNCFLQPKCFYYVRSGSVFNKEVTPFFSVPLHEWLFLCNKLHYI